MVYLCSRNQVEPYCTDGAGGSRDVLIQRYNGLQKFLSVTDKNGVNKKLQKFFTENLENKIKSVNLHPLSMGRQSCRFVKQS